MQKLKFTTFPIIASILVGCGGGGGGGDSSQTAVAVTSFPLQSGYKALVAGGSAKSATVSGTCTGSATLSASAPSASTFEGASALSAVSTITVNLTNCTPASSAVTATNYYDSNYNPLGSSIAGVEYVVFDAAPSPLPASAKIGDTSVYGTQTAYSSSTKQVVRERRTFSYVIEADGSSGNTAIANLISKAFNTANQPLYTSQTKYRIAADGTLTLVLIDVQYSTTSTTHLVYTVN